MPAADAVSPQRFYLGTKADLKPGDLVEPGGSPDDGNPETTSFVYLTSAFDAAAWEAELAPGEGPGRIYMVEPTGAIMDDPDLEGQEDRRVRRSHTAPGTRCGSRASARIRTGTRGSSTTARRLT